jgi:hypothetical protein
MGTDVIILHASIAILAVLLLIIVLKVEPIIALVVGSLYSGSRVEWASSERWRRSPPASARSWPRSGC